MRPQKPEALIVLQLGFYWLNQELIFFQQSCIKNDIPTPPSSSSSSFSLSIKKDLDILTFHIYIYI
jgi:hypothetical protein